MKRGVVLRDVLCPRRCSVPVPNRDACPVSPEGMVHVPHLLTEEDPAAQFDCDALYARLLALRRTNTEARFVTVTYPRTPRLTFTGSALPEHGGKECTSSAAPLTLHPWDRSEVQRFHDCVRTVASRIPRSVLTLIPQLVLAVEETTVGHLERSRMPPQELFTALHDTLGLQLGFPVVSVLPRDGKSLSWACTTPAVSLIHIGVFSIKQSAITVALRERDTRKALLRYKTSKAFEVELLVHPVNLSHRMHAAQQGDLLEPSVLTLTDAPECDVEAPAPPPSELLVRARDIEAENALRLRLFQEATRTRVVTPSYRHVLFVEKAKKGKKKVADETIAGSRDATVGCRSTQPVKAPSAWDKQNKRKRSRAVAAMISKYKPPRRLLRLRRQYDDKVLRDLVLLDPPPDPRAPALVPIFIEEAQAGL